MRWLNELKSTLWFAFRLMEFGTVNKLCLESFCHVKVKIKPQWSCSYFAVELVHYIAYFTWCQRLITWLFFWLTSSSQMLQELWLLQLFFVLSVIYLHRSTALTHLSLSLWGLTLTYKTYCILVLTMQYLQEHRSIQLNIHTYTFLGNLTTQSVYTTTLHFTQLTQDLILHLLI